MVHVALRSVVGGMNGCGDITTVKVFLYVGGGSALH